MLAVFIVVCHLYDPSTLEKSDIELDWRLSVLESDIRAMNVRYSSSADQSQSNVVSNSDRPTGYLKLLQNLVLQGSQQTKIGEV